jgi:hypothetical protein
MNVLLRTGVDQWPHKAWLPGAVAECHGADFRLEQREELVVDAFLHVDPLYRRAQLAAVGGLGGDDGGGSRFKVGVDFDDGRGLTAQFPGRFGDVGLAVVEHDATGVDATGQGDQPHGLMGANSGGDGVIHGQDVDHAGTSIDKPGRLSKFVGVHALGRGFRHGQAFQR